MTTHAQSAIPAWVIRNQRIFSTQERARKALEALRLADWREGRDRTHDFTEADKHAHVITDAVAELVALALHVEDDEVAS